MTFFYPFVGEKDLIKCLTTTFSISGYPEISIEQGHISLRYEKENITKMLVYDLNSIRSGIEYANADVKGYNDSLHSLAIFPKKSKRSNPSFRLQISLKFR
jgi:hypothetical protein